MASVYGNVTEEFEVTLLRGRDASDLAAAVRPRPGTPNPVAIATGPRILGPSSAVGAGDTWGVGVRVDGYPNLCWVVRSLDTWLMSKSTMTTPDRVVVAAEASVSAAETSQGPFLHYSSLTAVAGSSGGTYNTLNINTGWAASATPVTDLWWPLRPSLTVDGWRVGVWVIAASGGGIAIDDAYLDMQNCLLLGYPVNMWNTGALWAHGQAA